MASDAADNEPTNTAASPPGGDGGGQTFVEVVIERLDGCVRLAVLTDGAGIVSVLFAPAQAAALGERLIAAAGSGFHRSFPAATPQEN